MGRSPMQKFPAKREPTQLTKDWIRAFLLDAGAILYWTTVKCGNPDA